MGEGMRNNEERIALLKDIVRVAPAAHLGVHFAEGRYSEDGRMLAPEFIRFGDCDDSDEDFDLWSSDRMQGEHIIVMLDAMEEAGHFPELAPYKSMNAADGMGKIGAGMRSDAGFRYCCCLMDHNAQSPEHWEPLQIFNGNTRAEAVARAFVEVFKVSTPSTPNNQENQEDDNGKD